MNLKLSKLFVMKTGHKNLKRGISQLLNQTGGPVKKGNYFMLPKPPVSQRLEFYQRRHGTRFYQMAAALLATWIERVTELS